MNGIIYIFGPSCSGKSTLARTLQNHLAFQWTYIDRDELIESGMCIESAADTALDEKIRTVKDRVIVDAQIPWREKEQGEIYCLLLPPLERLLERDAQRTERLKRSERRAFYAREYVVSTHGALCAMDRKKFDVCVDSSLLSMEEIALKVLQLLESKNKGLS